MKRSRKLFCVVALAAVLCACSEQELYAQLSQQQANEMVALLRNSGIAAEKEVRENSTFAISAPRDSFSRAIEVLRANGYPRDGYDSLGQVFKKEGFVSSPLEERARLMHALSQEIANTLSSIDGVLVARVHLSVPEKDLLADKAPPSAASVFIKYRAGTDLSGQQGHIKALVVNAIQGLSYDNVTVALFPAEPWPAQAKATTAQLGAWAGPLLWIAAIASALLCAGAALGWFQRSRARSQREAQRALVVLPAHSTRVSN